MFSFKRFSFLVLVLSCIVISLYRLNVVRENEISWDVLGYYYYLPATFIHKDPLLKDISWLEKVNEEKKLTGTLYMVSQNEKGEPMYFFLMGMALFYLPFFLFGSASASILGFPVDGFSLPYQYCLVIGGLVYTIIGLIYLRKILNQFFSESISALVLLIVVFGTNYINHLTIDNLGTVNVIFMLTTLVLWHTMQWHSTYKGKHLVVVCVCIVLAAIVKPTEVFCVVIPLLWGVTSLKDLKQKFSVIFSQWNYILLALLICVAIALPQMLYWYEKTGKLIYDSYKNPGVGLDFLSPHITEVLFSYRKGWLLYTPIMIFAILGFYFLFKSNRKIFYASSLYFLISFYIISSWSEWWYGAGFSNRPLIATYPVLAISLGYFINYVLSSNLFTKISLSVIGFLLVCLNQFQWWQYKNYILDPYRTTKDYYWAIFLKTTVSEEDRKSLLVFRDFSGKFEFTEQDRYNKSSLLFEDFEGKKLKGNEVEEGNSFYRLSSEMEFLPLLEASYNELSNKDHAWIKVKMDVRLAPISDGSLPCVVNTMERIEGSYGYGALGINIDTLDNKWRRVETVYLTPEIRSVEDKFKCYIWNYQKSNVDLDNIEVEVFTRKE